MRKSSPKRDYKDYLADIVYSIGQIEKFITGFNFKNFSSDTKTQDAIIRRLEVIGEAVNALPAKFKN